MHPAIGELNRRMMREARRWSQRKKRGAAGRAALESGPL